MRIRLVRITDITGFLLGIILLFIHCSPSKKSVVDKDELIKYISDKKNGLIKEQDVNGIKVKLSYQPYQLFVLQELDGLANGNDSSQINRFEEKYKTHYYFKLKFSKNGKEAIRQLGDFNRYSEMVQVLSFRMGQFVNLTTPLKDTIDLSDYIFDQTYGMSDGNTVLLSFDKKKLEKSETLDINIAECGFGTGSLKFSFRNDDIFSTPDLIYSK